MKSSLVTSYITKSSASKASSSSSSSRLAAASSGTVVQKSTNANLEIPTASENPFLESTRFRQGTLYEIIFPIIGGFLFLYVLGVVINKYKASKQAKVVEPFDKDYEFGDYTANDKDGNGNNGGEEELDNPFSDRYESSNKSFTHKKNLSSVDFISQYRRSMDHLSGMTMSPQTNNYYNDDSFTNLGHHTNHSKSQSIGSVLQLNFGQQPQLAPQSQSQNNSSDPDNSVFYSMVGTESPAAGQDDTESRDNNTDKASFYSLAEPSKAAKNATVNIPNHKSHFHHRKLSSLVLDEFISTGELPALSDQARTLHDISYENGTGSGNPVMQNARNNASVESHSMFEDSSFNNSYDIPDSDFAVKHSVARSPSPRRNNHIGMYRQNSSRSPTRSPVRSPAKSPTRGAFSNV